MKLCHIDTETTGLTDRHGVIQIAGIVENGEKVSPFNYKVQPYPQDEIEESALRVNNTTIEDIRGFLPAGTVKGHLDKLFGATVKKFDKADKMWFVGYNASFDWNMMQAFYRKAGDKYFGSFFQFPVIDTAVMAAIMIGSRRRELPNFKLGTVCEFLDIKIEGDLHDALTDVRLSREIMLMFCERFDTDFYKRHENGAA